MQIAHNPETGEYLGLMDGQWQPIKVARNESTGEMLYQDASGRWQPAGRSQTAPGRSPEDPSELGWGEALWQGVQNIPSSAWRLAGNLADAVLNPVDTAEAIWKTGAGAATKAARLVNPDLPRQDEERYAEAVGQYVADRYGGLDNIKQTWATDPAGLLSDASTAFMGGAGLAKGAAALGKGARAVGAAVSPAISAEAGPLVRAMEVTGRGLSSAARATDPLAIAIRTPGAVAGAGNAVARKIGFEPPIQGSLSDAAARKLYEQALNLSVGFSENGKARYSPQQIRAMVDTGLEEQIPLTARGYRQAQEKIHGLNDRIDRAIAETEAGGVQTDPYKVGMDAMTSDARWALQDQATPKRDINAFARSVDEYLDSHGVDNTSVSGMQKTKQATYQANQSRFRNNAAPMANGRVEANMELARQQRLEIGRAVDEAHKQGLLTDKEWTTIHDINAREGNLIELRDAMERTLQKSGKKPVVNALLAGIMGTATGDLGTGVALGAAWELAKSPWFRSQAALKLHNMGEIGLPSTAWTPAMAAQYAASNNRALQKWYEKNYPNRGLLDLIGAE